MPYETDFDAAFTILLGKASSTTIIGGNGTGTGTGPVPIPGGTGLQQPPAVTLNYVWGGGQSPLIMSNMNPMLLEVPINGDLIYAHMYAGDASGRPSVVSASVSLLITNVGSWGAGALLSGSGVTPQLAGTAVGNPLTLNWRQHFVTGDAVIAVPTAFIGQATWMALTLQIRSSDVQIGVTGVSAQTTPITDANGNPIVVRG